MEYGTLLGNSSTVVPNQQPTLNNLPTKLQCRNFIIKHQLIIRLSAPDVQICMYSTLHIFQPSFQSAVVGGWVLLVGRPQEGEKRRRRRRGKKSMAGFAVRKTWEERRRRDSRSGRDRKDRNIASVSP